MERNEHGIAKVKEKRNKQKNLKEAIAINLSTAEGKNYENLLWISMLIIFLLIGQFPNKLH